MPDELCEQIGIGVQRFGKAAKAVELRVSANRQLECALRTTTSCQSIVPCSGIRFTKRICGKMKAASRQHLSLRFVNRYSFHKTLYYGFVCYVKEFAQIWKDHHLPCV